MKGKIKSLTIVTQEGVSTYMVGCCNVTEIKEAIYGVCGDCFPCFHVLHDNELIAEIRVVHLCEITYSPPNSTAKGGEG